MKFNREKPELENNGDFQQVPRGNFPVEPEKTAQILAIN